MTDDPAADEIQNALDQLQKAPCFQLYLGWHSAAAFYKEALGDVSTPQKMYVLTVLASAKECTMSQLADAMHVELGSISGMVSRMQQDGLVERRPGKVKKSQSMVSLTRKGRAAFTKASKQIEELDQTVLAQISNRDLQSLQRVVKVFLKMEQT